MRIIELNEGELPFKSAVTYPGIGLKIARLKHSETNTEIIIESDFLVRINRDGLDYLIRIVVRQSTFSEDKLTNVINSVVTESNVIAEKTMIHYIVDENISGNISNGLDIVIYKYKKSDYAKV